MIQTAMPDAYRKYREARREIYAELERINERLASHKREASEHRTDWGYTGDMNHVLSQLKEILP